MLTCRFQTVDRFALIVATAIVGAGLVVSGGCAPVRSSPFHPSVYVGQIAPRSESARNSEDLVSAKGGPRQGQPISDDASGPITTRLALDGDQSDAVSKARSVGEVVLFVAAAGLLLIVLLWK
jgi:hypothetical protein